jgi:integrase
MRGDGRVFKRGEVFWISYYVHGTEYRERGGPTEKAAKNKLRERMAEKFGQRFIGPKAERLTVNDLLDSLISELETRGAKAMRTLRSHVIPVRKALGELRVPDISTRSIERYATERLTEKKSKATVNREVGTLKQAFHLARKQERISRVPYFPMFREENVRQGFFEKHEFEALLKALPEHLADVARFAHMTGWRRGEILPLRWEAIDRSAREARLSTSKNGKGRVLPLEGKLWELIERRWRCREFVNAAGVSSVSPMVFHLRGRRLVDFRKSWQKACVDAGLGQYVHENGRVTYRGKQFHDFRRTAVRNLIRAGVPQAVAKKISGHETDSIFGRYNIVSEEDKRSAISRTEAYLAGVQSNVSDFPNGEHGQDTDSLGSSR